MPIKYEKNGAIGVFTMDTHKHNLLTPEVYEPFFHEYCDFLVDDEVKVGILWGGDRQSFCVGDDLMANADRPYLSPPSWPMIISQQKRSKPIIGAVHGWCLGQGMVNLMNLTDIRVASPDAKFGLPEIKYGMGGGGGAANLPKQLPRNVAMYLLLTGDYFSAEQAKDAFIINEIVEKENLFTRANEIAERIARHPLIGITTEMDSFNFAADIPRGQLTNVLANAYTAQRNHHVANQGADINFKQEKLQQAK